MSSGATLVTGIATLLLAMGVGVEIGRINNNSGPQRASSPGVQVVTDGGAGGGGTAAANNSQATGKTKKAAKGNKGGQTKVVHLTKQVTAKANAAAAQVLGASGKNLAPATVQPGQSCAHGAGCQGGKFTGNFFGP